jgi:hypothetical protein
MYCYLIHFGFTDPSVHLVHKHEEELISNASWNSQNYVYFK